MGQLVLLQLKQERTGSNGCASRFWVESERRFIQVCQSRCGSWVSSRHTSTLRKRVSEFSGTLACASCLYWGQTFICLSHYSFSVDNNPFVRFHPELRCTPGSNGRSALLAEIHLRDGRLLNSQGTGNSCHAPLRRNWLELVLTCLKFSEKSRLAEIDRRF